MLLDVFVGLIKFWGLFKVNKLGGVKFWWRVGKDRGGKGRE